MQKLTALYIIIHLCTTGQVAYDTIGAPDNKAVFDVLCALTSLANWKGNIQKLDTSGYTSYSDMLKLNMTLSTQEWQKLFAKQGSANVRPTEPPKPQQAGTNWPQMWQSWIETATQLEAPEAVANTLEAAKLEHASEQEKRAVRGRLQPLLARTGRLDTKLTELQNDTKELTQEKVAKILNKAIYGDEVNTVSQYDPRKAFKDGPGSTAETSCKTGGSGAKAETVGATLVCVCHKENSGNEPAAPCNAGISHSSTVGGSFENTKTEFDEISKACVATAPKTLSAQYLRSALSAVFTQITAKATNTYLGIFLKSNCDGSKSDGLCVEYTGITAINREKLLEIPWIKTLNDLAKELQKTRRGSKTSRKDKSVAGYGAFRS
uniref:Variant surface glycoprotein 1125.1381 n=1 Tax=Trypanosoma brucei TaxID=5691 RepID=A0A1J0R6V1_9TRYP|nr:variant surface glycoprotein 1125.1381 [Trypanosoma brucei]